jgi:hypothetical protein
LFVIVVVVVAVVAVAVVVAVVVVVVVVVREQIGSFAIEETELSFARFPSVSSSLRFVASKLTRREPGRFVRIDDRLPNMRRAIEARRVRKKKLRQGYYTGRKASFFLLPNF